MFARGRSRRRRPPRFQCWPLALVLVVDLALSGIAAGKDTGIAIQWDPNSAGEKVSAIWLGYLMARAVYRPEHHIPSPPSGEIAPTFEEEVYAREAGATIYSELRQKDKDLNDGYWNDLLKVQANKFMPQYVWTYLRRPSWPKESQPAKMEIFRRWSSQNLRNHKSVTHGGLAVTNG